MKALSMAHFGTVVTETEWRELNAGKVREQISVVLVHARLRHELGDAVLVTGWRTVAKVEVR
jgi:hypothetical protein